MDLLAALQTVLDCVDYTSNACGPTEMVAAALPRIVIANAKEAIREELDRRQALIKKEDEDGSLRG